MAQYNDSLQAQLDAAQEMLNANLIEDAWLVLNRLDIAYPDSPEVIATMGDAALKVGDFEYAYEMFDRVIELEPVWSEAWSARARCRLEMCEFDAARADLEHATALDPSNPEAHYCLAIMAEFDGDEIISRHEYMQASMIDGDHFGIPFQAASVEDFESIVREVMARVRAEFPEYEEELTFAVMDLPSLEFCAETGLSPLITAYSPDDDDPGKPPHILFFRKNVERGCRSRQDLFTEIEASMLSELVPLDDLRPEVPSEELH